MIKLGQMVLIIGYTMQKSGQKGVNRVYNDKIG